MPSIHLLNKATSPLQPVEISPGIWESGLWLVSIERAESLKGHPSGITNDPNDWCKEHDEPRYIVDLIKRVTRVSLETMKIVNALPALNERI